MATAIEITEREAIVMILDQLRKNDLDSVARCRRRLDEAYKEYEKARKNEEISAHELERARSKYLGGAM